MALRFTIACQSVGGSVPAPAVSTSALLFLVYLDRIQNISEARRITPQIESGTAMTAALGLARSLLSSAAAAAGSAEVVMFKTA
jgi:hypothetical protein